MAELGSDRHQSPLAVSICISQSNRSTLKRGKVSNLSFGIRIRFKSVSVRYIRPQIMHCTAAKVTCRSQWPMTQYRCQCLELVSRLWPLDRVRVLRVGYGRRARAGGLPSISACVMYYAYTSTIYTYRVYRFLPTAEDHLLMATRSRNTTVIFKGELN